MLHIEEGADSCFVRRERKRVDFDAFLSVLPLRALFCQTGADQGLGLFTYVGEQG